MKSMTGFGQGAAKAGDACYCVEISSVNHKYFDISFRMPNSLMKHQSTLKTMLNEKIGRGHVEVYVSVNGLGCKKHVIVNEKAAADYLKSLEKLRKVLKIEEKIPYDFILKLPDVFRISEHKTEK